RRSTGLRRASATRGAAGLRGTARTRRGALAGSGTAGSGTVRLVHRPTGLLGRRLVGRLARGAASLGGDLVAQLLNLRSGVCGGVLDRLGDLLTTGAGTGGH